MIDESLRDMIDESLRKYRKFVGFIRLACLKSLSDRHIFASATLRRRALDHPLKTSGICS
jgi:hypothetical protein